jgi:hypothetical protein
MDSIIWLSLLHKNLKPAGMAKWQGNRFVSGRSRVRSPLPASVFFSGMKQRKRVEKQGIDPCASCMLSKRSTT